MQLLVPILNYAQFGTYALGPLAAAGWRATIAYPAFIALAFVWRGKWRMLLWIIVSATLQILLFTVFVLWLWVG